MSNDDREVILANYQAITGVDDIAVALATLEQFNWDINNAVVATVAEDSDDHIGPSAPSDTNTSFTVDWKGRVQSFSLNVSTTTIGMLKENLSSRVGVPKDQFTVIGFSTVRVQVDSASLEDMGVSQGCSLVMVETPSQLASRGQQSSATGRYKFRIKVEDTDYELVFPSSNKIRQIKIYIEANYNIPVNQQRWEGWPPGTSDSLELRDLVLETPSHPLRVTSHVTSHVTSRPPLVPSNPPNNRSLDSDEEFEELMDTPESSRGPSQRPLMTVGRSAEENILQFLQVFEERYGTTHPSFHIGTLRSALSSAFSLPADLKRPLIVFLHSDTALAGHLFCSQVICNENISSYIDGHFVLWVQDLTQKRIQQTTLTECQAIFGLDGRRQIETYIPEKLPLMIVITKVQSSPQVFAVFEGDISPDMLMARLVDAVENYNQTRSIEKAAEVEQEQRNQLRQLQEQEYLDSLQRDREKDSLKKIEEKEKQLQDETEEAKLSSFVDLIPSEPDSGIPTADITFKLPSGDRINRKFVHSTKLKILSYYIGSKGFPPASFKLVQNFPKRQFDEDEMELTLEDLGLTRREILYVEEKD